MSHIHTKPGEHDTTSSAYIVRFDTPKPQLLLHQHKSLGKLLQPGGHVELDENPWQAILREIPEETGYELSQLEILQPKERLSSLGNAILHPVMVCQNTHDFGDDPNHKHTDNSYAFATDSIPNNQPDSGESTDFLWVTIEELDKLTSDEIVPNVQEISHYVLSVCVAQWVRVKLQSFKV